MSLGKSFFLAALQREGASFREAISPDDLDKPVPPCPEWTVYDLVAHIGVSYQWHRIHLVREIISQPDHDRGSAPAGVAVLPWWEEQFAELLQVLAEIDPHTPAWNWSVQPHEAIFWHRRMAHETAVHRWDAQVSVSLPEPIDPQLAVDGVDEVLDSHLPAEWAAREVPVAGVVRIEATDVDARWLIRVRNAGISLLDTGGWFDDVPAVHAAMTGTASDLMLALWGRIPLSLLTVRGETRLVAALLTSE